MKRSFTVILILLIVTSLFIQCGNLGGINGEPNQWMKGKTISVKVVFENIGVSVWLRNDTQKDFTLKDLRLTLWSDDKGRSELKDWGNIWLAPADSLILPPFGYGDEYEVNVAVVQDGKTIDSFTVEL